MIFLLQPYMFPFSILFYYTTASDIHPPPLHFASGSCVSEVPFTWHLDFLSYSCFFITPGFWNSSLCVLISPDTLTILRVAFVFSEWPSSSFAILFSTKPCVRAQGQLELQKSSARFWFYSLHSQMLCITSACILHSLLLVSVWLQCVISFPLTTVTWSVLE